MRSEWPACTLKMAGWSSWICHFAVRWNIVLKRGETNMGDKGSKDKGKREQQKKAQLTQKEKRKLKREKKKK